MLRTLKRLLRRGYAPDPAQLEFGMEATTPKLEASADGAAVSQADKTTSDTDAVQSPGSSARAAEAMLERLHAAGLRGISRCALTRNRSVLVSVRGDVLRLHEAFLGAPDDVLAAIAALTGARTRAARLAARKLIVGYRAAAFPASTDANSRMSIRRTRTQPADIRMAERLRQAHDRLNMRHFAGQLGAVNIEVSRRMKRRLGHYAPGSGAGDETTAPEIAISRRHIRRDGWKQAEHTLLHEMVHQWQHETGRTLDHGHDFRRKARDVGIDPRATRRPEPVPAVGRDE